MKFRVLVIVFNAVIVASFAVIFMMPMLVLGWEYTGTFWARNWPFGLAFAAILVGVNIYFIYNWKVFSMLERESWDELIAYLEQQVYERGRFGGQRVKILINAYILRAGTDKIGDLEAFLREKRPGLVPRFSIELGIPYLTSQDAAAMEAFFGELKDKPRCSRPLWVRWNYAFALMLQSRADEAQGVLSAVMEETRDPLQQLLAAYLLNTYGADDDNVARQVERVRSGLATRATRESFARFVEKHRDNVQVLLLSQLIRDALDWLFAGSTEE